MHFWIGKRTQGYGLNQRNLVPPSLSGYGHNNHLRHLRSAFHHHQPMVTPVHRFQSIESVVNYNGARHGRSPNYRASQASEAPPLPASQYTRPEGEPIPSSRPPDACKVHVKCKLLFVIAFICCMIIAKFWIGFTMGWEAVGVCSLISFFFLCRMLGVCFKSAVPEDDWRSNVMSYQERRLEAYRSRHSEERAAELAAAAPCPPEVRVAVVPTVSLSEEPPPPYHIAQSMPSRNDEITRNVPESPPPSYDKAAM